MMLTTFPAESVPDGSIWLPHQFIIGVWGLLFVTWLLTFDDDKPWVLIGGLSVSLYGWYHVWASLPVTGAGLVVVGLMLATGALGRYLWRSSWRIFDSTVWSALDRRVRDTTALSSDGGRRVRHQSQTATRQRRLNWLAIVFLLIAWDDIFAHAFGVSTPLDWVWTWLLAPILA